MVAIFCSKSHSDAASEMVAPGDKVDGDTSIGFLRSFLAGFFEMLAVRPFIKKPIAELARMTSTPPIEPYRAISHRLFLESVRKHQAGLQSFRSMRRIEASRRNASALRLRFSQSLASLRQRLSHAKVRSTIQRRGSTTNPFVRLERLTISVSS